MIVVRNTVGVELENWGHSLQELTLTSSEKVDSGLLRFRCGPQSMWFPHALLPLHLNADFTRAGKYEFGQIDFCQPIHRPHKDVL